MSYEIPVFISKTLSSEELQAYGGNGTKVRSASGPCGQRLLLAHSCLVLPQAEDKFEAMKYFKVNLITHISPPVG